MHKIYISAALLVTLLFSQKTFAQMPALGGSAGITGYISGYLLDSVTQKPIEFASIALSPSGLSKITNGEVTDENGKFKISNLSQGDYDLTMTFIGYRDKKLTKIKLTREKPDASLGKLFLSSNTQLLNEVEVVGQAALIEQKVDKLVYNAEKDVTASTGDASDVLRKVPMVTVDLEGNVQLRGSSAVRILINNKPSGIMANSVADAMRMIPANQIKSVEVITNPSAKYDAEGTSGIINIITKKSNIEGLTGTVNAALGTRLNNLNASLSRKSGRLSINSSVGGNFFVPQNGYNTFYRTDTSNDTTRTLSQSGTSGASRGGGSVSLGFDYDINGFNNVSSTLRVNRFLNHNDNVIGVLFADPRLTTNQQYRRNTVNDFAMTGLDWTSDFRRTFKTPQREWSASAQLSHNQNKQIYELDQRSDTQFFLNRKENSDNVSANDEITVQTDYAHPFGKLVTLETGLKTIIRVIKSDLNYNNVDANGTLLPDLIRSNQFRYEQDVFAGYASATWKLPKKIDLRTGFRLEHTEIYGDFRSPNTEFAAFRNRYDSPIPSITISKIFKDFSTAKMSYTKRIQRPSLFYLNPFVNASDPRNISFGNPKLTPELSDVAELGYSSFRGAVAFSLTGYFRYTKDVIQSVLTVLPNGISATSYQNLGHSQNAGINGFGSIAVLPKWTVRGSVNVYFSQLNGVVQNVATTNEGWNYNLTLMSSWQFKGGWAAEFFGLLNSRQLTLQGRNPAFNLVNFGLKKEFWKKKGSLSLTVSNPFEHYIKFKSDLKGVNFVQNSEIGIPFRSFGVNFTYSFGKVEFKNPMNKKKGINNDDLKQGENSQF